MPFYEISYETGRVSVAEYADDMEATNAITAHHERAIEGQPGGPLGQPAERIAKVRVYKTHPNEYNSNQTMSADVLSKEVEAMIKKLADSNGVVAIDRLAVEIRALTHPMVGYDHKDKEPFASVFLMKQEKELKLGLT